MLREILLVDDNDDCREVQTLTLKDAGYLIAEARNGVEALERVRKKTPALIIMDVSMPVMDGLTAARELRGHPSSQHVPIIAQTAYASALMDDQSLFFAVVHKPADPDEVLWIVASALARGSE